MTHPYSRSVRDSIALFVCAEPSTRFLNLCVAQQESQLLPARAHPVLSTSCEGWQNWFTHTLSMTLSLVPPSLSLSLTHTLPLSESGNGWVSALLLLVSKTECTLNMNANELSNKTWKLQNLKTSIKVRPRGCEMWGGGDNRGRKLSNSMGNCDFNCTSSLVGLR